MCISDVAQHWPPRGLDESEEFHFCRSATPRKRGRLVLQTRLIFGNLLLRWGLVHEARGVWSRVDERLLVARGVEEGKDAAEARSKSRCVPSNSLAMTLSMLSLSVSPALPPAPNTLFVSMVEADGQQEVWMGHGPGDSRRFPWLSHSLTHGRWQGRRPPRTSSRPPKCGRCPSGPSVAR